MYQALYRKWRPRSFDEVSGQAHITETLKRQVMSGKLSHAYLFTGTRGTGKTTCAKILAKAVNCENPENGNPCLKCSSCLGIDSGGIMDVTEMDAASNNGVDNVRALREEAVYLPASVKKRVYIVDEVHMLTGAAFNALLKILEEPPPHLMFILATTELHKVPATILSRCQKFAFKRALPFDLQNRLSYIAVREGMDLTEEASELLSRLADGSFRDAVSLLDQCSGGAHIDRAHVLRCIGLAENDEICGLLSDLLHADAHGALNRLSRLYADGKDVSSVLSQLASLYRDVLLCKLASGGALMSGAFSEEDLRHFTKSVPLSRLMSGLTALQTVLGELDRSADRKIAAELCLLRLCDLPAVEETVTVSDAKAKEEKKTNTVSIPGPEASPAAAAVPAPEPQARVMNGPEILPASFDAQKSWKSLLDVLSKNMDSFLFGILEDTNHAEAEIGGDTLLIYAKSPFSMGLIDTKEVKEALKTAAEQCFKGVYTVKVTQAEPGGSDKKSKLENLSRFNNITFE